MRNDLQEILWNYAEKYRVAEFLEDDPLQIPRRFSIKGDIEISAFFSAIMAWGQRKSIIKSSNELLNRMDNAPLDFVLNFEESDAKVFEGFVHRTLNSADVVYILRRFQTLYKAGKSLESAFALNQLTDEINSSNLSDQTLNLVNSRLDLDLDSARSVNWDSARRVNLDSASTINSDSNSGLLFSNPLIVREDRVKNGLSNFYDWMFESGENRTKKHISDPRKKSACKRLNMFLRWMVRENDGLDFGIWNTITPAELMMPLDVHVLRMTEELGIAQNIKGNWDGCEHLTSIFREIHPADPTLFDFALFGLGVDYRRQLN
jgi:uncharacterized protein (TIGR02757 family)